MSDACFVYSQTESIQMYKHCHEREGINKKIMEECGTFAPNIQSRPSRGIGEKTPGRCLEVVSCSISPYNITRLDGFVQFSKERSSHT